MSTVGQSAPAVVKPESRSTSAPAVTLISWSLALWLLMVLIRGYVTGYGLYWVRSPLEQAWPVFAAGYLDFVYVAGLCACFLVLGRVARRPVLQRVLCRVYVAVAVLSLVWAMVNVEVVKLIGQPLNYPWLYYSGFLRGFDAQQAIGASFSWTVPAVGVSVIVGMAVLAFALRKCFGAALNWGHLARYLVVGGLVLAVGYVPLAAWAMRDFYRPFLQNPVVAFVESVIVSGKPRIYSLVSDVGNADFQVAAERGSRAQSSFVLANPPVRNVLVIVLESVAAQYLPAYGSGYPVTPELDRYRDHTRLFQSIYAHAPNTNKSMVSLLCSTYPWPTYRFETKEHPSAGFVSISDVLKEKGYRTGFFYAADLRFGGAQEFLVNHQFDALKDYRSIGDGQAALKSNEKTQYLDGAKDGDVANALLSWLGAGGSRPFFALMWSGQTHYPYFPSGQGQGFEGVGSLESRYLEAVRETDRAIGQIMRTLEEQGLLDSTLVVVLGDHGEAFGQHNQFGHGNKLFETPAVVGEQFGHGCRLYEENIHIPLMLISRRLFKSEQDAVVGGMVDIAPTILDVLGVATPDGWQGESLFGSQRSPRTYFLAPWSGASFGYREGDRKYVFDAVADRCEVFDLKQDPKEAHDLASETPKAELDHVQKRLAGWIQYQDQLMAKLARTPLPTRPVASEGKP